MAAQIQFAGQFLIDNVKIFSSSSSVVDITENILAINLYEDIYKSSMSGDITVVDTNNILMETPINGQDFIGFKITTPGLDELAIDYTEHVFVINQIINQRNIT